MANACSKASSFDLLLPDPEGFCSAGDATRSLSGRTGGAGEEERFEGSDDPRVRFGDEAPWTDLGLKAAAEILPSFLDKEGALTTSEAEDVSPGYRLGAGEAVREPEPAAFCSLAASERLFACDLEGVLGVLALTEGDEAGIVADVESEGGLGSVLGPCRELRMNASAGVTALPNEAD